MAAEGGTGEPSLPDLAAPRLAIIADDLTGAADAAAAFASRGFPTVVALTGTPSTPASVVARFSGARDLPEADAIRLARMAVKAIRASGEPERWYQKIDSVLRGHPGPELATTMAALGLERALVAPALPAEGRTVVGGRVFVDGRLLPDSSFGGRISASVADHLRRPIAGRIVHLSPEDLDEGLPALAARLAECDRGVVVADARNEADLCLLARAALAAGPLLLCGSAGLANAVAAALAEGSIDVAAPPSPSRPAASRPILVVAGSHHPATGRQIDRLAAAEALVVRPPRLAPDEDGAAIARLSRDVAAGLAAGRTVVLTAIGCPDVRLSGAAIADRLACIAAQPEILGATGGLVATGGEVAAALFRAAGATALRLGGAVRPAIPWGVLEGGAATGLPVVTKAGSFGDDRALADCTAFLRGADPPEAASTQPVKA